MKYGGGGSNSQQSLSNNGGKTECAQKGEKGRTIFHSMINRLLRLPLDMLWKVS